MQVSTLEVLDCRTLEGVSKKTGNPYKMTMAQCVIVKSDGGRIVGELSLPDNLSKTPPGIYAPTFDLESYQGKVQAKLVALTAVTRAQAPK